MFKRHFVRAVLCRVWLPITLAVIVGLANERGVARAQQSAAPTIPRNSSGPSATVGSSTSEADQKARIMASDRWKRVEQEFHQWLSVQVVSTPEQVDQMKAKLNAQIRNMSAAELSQFLDQWDAKLKILLGKDASEARQWLGEYLSVIADGYRPQFLKKLGITDVTNLTAAQIEDELDKLRAERMEFQEQRAFFDANRQQWVQRSQQWQAASNASLQQAGEGTAAEYGTYQTPYSPRQYNYQPLPPLIPFFW